MVTENLKKCRMIEQAAVHQKTWDAFLKTSKTRYSLIFLDPPYRSGLCLAAMEALCEGHLANHAIVVCETAPEETLPEQVGPLALSKTTKYGIPASFCIGRWDWGKESDKSDLPRELQSRHERACQRL